MGSIRSESSCKTVPKAVRFWLIVLNAYSVKLPVKNIALTLDIISSKNIFIVVIEMLYRIGYRQFAVSITFLKVFDTSIFLPTGDIVLPQQKKAEHRTRDRTAH